jgi:gluconokinase
LVTDKTRQTPCALIVMGVSGSGKSTIAGRLAERLHWTCEDGDRFHPESNVEKMSAGHPLTDEDRRPWLQAIADEIDRVCHAGERAVFACSALKRSYRDILVHGRDDVRIIYLKGSFELIAKRLALRTGHFMPPALLESQFKTLEPPGADEDAIVADIAPPVEEIIDHIVAQLAPGPLDRGADREKRA